MVTMTGAQRTAAYRERLRARGLRQIQLIVPEIREQIRRDAEKLKGHPSTREGEEIVEPALADIWTARDVATSCLLSSLGIMGRRARRSLSRRMTWTPASWTVSSCAR